MTNETTTNPAHEFRRIVWTTSDLAADVRFRLDAIRQTMTAGNMMAAENGPFGERLREGLNQMDDAISALTAMRDTITDGIRIFDNEHGGVWE